MAKSNLEKQLEDLEKLRQRGVLTDEEYAQRRTAIMAQPGVQVVQQGGSGVGKVFKWGCLGIVALFGLFVIIGLIAVAASSGGDEDDENPNAGRTGTPGAVGTNPGDVHVPLRSNSSGEIAPERNNDKKVRVTILQIADNVTSSNQFAQPAAGKKWWGVEVVVENVGTSEASSLSWKLRDSADGEHDNTFVVGAGEMLNVLFNLTPGGKTQGWVYFEIPEDASPKWLRADPNIFLKNDLYFNAE